jgi:hypothetical protein
MLECTALGVISGAADWLRLLPEEQVQRTVAAWRGLEISGLFPKAFAYLTDVAAALQRHAVGGIDESRCPDMPLFSARPRSEAGGLRGLRS